VKGEIEKSNLAQSRQAAKKSLKHLGLILNYLCAFAPLREIFS